ncbi:hypothetical protein Daesc_003851 [Daldinia eschscholtzii]|uniref:Deoxyribonuclease NucA/NucB domain-containing protein n=1 Tax=Daldinia eschscholtzii TaxID=292717 RepID=A0AAX6MMN8_9PEZI
MGLKQLSIWAIAALLAGVLGVEHGAGLEQPSPPGRGNRLFPRVPKDFGTFDVDCAGAEGACNNACWNIRCLNQGVADANKVVYIGPNNKAENDRNRFESGCQTADNSVCGSYPFSQAFYADQSKAGDMNCDEWPPAVAQQPPFAQKQKKNSLRCIPARENSSLGSKLKNFIHDQGGPYSSRPKGPMARDDFFRITFDVSKADKSKVPYCTIRPSSCTQDGYQFEMRKKANQNGKISAPYNHATDNAYSYQDGPWKDVLQCSVELTRDGDNTFGDMKLFNHLNDKDVSRSSSCSVQSATGDCEVKGLPNPLTISKTGGFGTKIGFHYPNPNFSWDSESTGDGKGPATNAGQPLRFCKVDSISKTQQKVECWFPCFETASGK